MKMNKFYALCRMLHIYISTALFSLLVFFCVSGLLLNHLSWITHQDKQAGVNESKLPHTIAEGLQHNLTAMNALAFVEPYIASKYKLTDLAKFDWDKDLGEFILDYPVPAGYALVVVNTSSFEYTIEYQQANVLSVLNDLHKGRHSGAVWSVVIDVTAILVCLFSLTGLLILFQNKRKRQLGMWLTLLGSVTPIVIYYFFVPQLTGVL